MNLGCQPLLVAVCALFLSHAYGASSEPNRRWPDAQVYLALRQKKDLDTFQLRVFRSGSDFAGSVVIGAQLQGKYQFSSPRGNLFPERFLGQFGEYLFKLSDDQFVTVLDALRDSPFSLLEHPARVEVDTAIMAICLNYAGKERFLRFPVKEADDEFRKLWNAILGVVRRSEFVPERALAISLSVPAQVAKGEIVPLHLAIHNIGRCELAIPNPVSASSKGRLLITLSASKMGAKSEPQRSQVLLGRGEDVAASVRISPSGNAKLGLRPESFSLAEPGDYSVVAEVSVGLPEGPDGKMGIVGTAVTPDARIRVQ